jgi:PAS domain S-box-containing protein
MEREREREFEAVIDPMAAPARTDTVGHDETYFRHLAEAIPQIVFITDVHGNVEYYNQYWYTYTGLPVGTYRTEDWIATVHPDDRARLVAYLATRQAADDPFEAEYRLRRRDGVYRWHLGRGAPVKDAAGNVIKRFGAAVDITEQKEAAERLRYYAILIENMPDAVITTDADYLIRGWNPGAERIYGWQADEVIGLHAPDILRTAFGSGDTDTQAWPVAFNDRGQWHGEFVQRRKDGTPIRVASTITHVRDEGGAALGVTAINRDVTQERSIEENLRFLAEASKVLGSSLDYRTTLASVAQLGVPEIADWCTVDMLAEDGSIEQLALAHIDPEKVQWARELNKANPPDPNAPTGVPNVLRTGRSEFYPVITDEMLVAVAKNEEELALIRRIGFSSAMTVPLRIQERAIGAMTFVTAESGRHYTGADLAFAEEVASRAALAVENARLYRDAQRAIAVRDEFMSLASHELKTPVTSLKMYTQVLQRQAERRGDADLADRLVKMDRQTDKLTGLINDLLNVTRIQTGQLEYVDEVVDLNAIVHECVDAIQPTTTKHHIFVEGTIDGRVWGDSERIGQVVTNLLTNAVKYSPRADRVLVRLNADAGNAVISVRDFGIGIGEEHREKIFEQFYRVSDPSEKTYPGLGLGLFIAGEIVKRHGGTIIVQSASGEGTTFTLTLPLQHENGGRA